MELATPLRPRLTWQRVALWLLTALSLLFVWPTAYRVYAACPGYVRVNRFTGHAESLTVEGWRAYLPLPAERRGFGDLADSLRAIETRDAQHRAQTGIVDRP